MDEECSGQRRSPGYFAPFYSVLDVHLVCMGEKKLVDFVTEPNDTPDKKLHKKVFS